jgi:hypothetical protein
VLATILLCAHEIELLIERSSSSLSASSKECSEQTQVLPCPANPIVGAAPDAVKP